MTVFPELQPTDSVILSTLIFVPAVGALGLLLANVRESHLARSFGIFVTLLAFIASVVVAASFAHLPAQGKTAVLAFQHVERYSWLPDFGVEYVLGIDGLSMALVLLTTFLMVLVMVGSESIHERRSAYIGCLLLLETGMLGSLLALDGFTFYVFWELMLIPMYFLIGVWGGARRVYAALKFVIYTALGSLLMLVAMVTLAYLHKEQFGHYSFFLGDWMKLHLSMTQEYLLFSAFALAFAIKVPIFPFHTWLPDAHVEAPTGGSVILAGVMLKLGLYGLIRFCVPIFPFAAAGTAWLFGVFGVIGIVYGALVAWVQTDVKKLVAYSSVSHLGFCVLGYATFNLVGMQGAILQMVNHGISTAALFFLVGVLYDRTHTRRIADYGGIGAQVPLYATVFLIFTLSSIGLPVTNGFVGEFLILLGGFGYSKVLGAIAVSGVILGAIYMLSLYRRMVFGPIDAAKNGALADLLPREKLVFAPLIIAVFWLGLFPQPVLNLTEPTARWTLEAVKNAGTESRYSKRTDENAVKVAAADTDLVTVADVQKRN